MKKEPHNYTVLIKKTKTNWSRKYSIHLLMVSFHSSRASYGPCQLYKHEKKPQTYIGANNEITHGSIYYSRAFPLSHHES